MRLWEPWICAGVAFGATLLLLPAVRLLGEHFALYDPPGPLKIHDRPITRIGGIAMMAGLGVAAAIYISFGHRVLIATCIVTLFLWLVNLVDDLRNISAIVRLVCQFLAAGLLWLCGWRLPVGSSALLSSGVTILVIVFLVNAFNMLDGADGLAAGVTAVIALGYCATNAALGNEPGTVGAASVLAVCVAFLLFNFYPARMFMGDSGSTLLGLMVALMSLDFIRLPPAGPSRLIIPLLFGSLPIVDAGAAVVRRIVRGKSPLVGDRSHSYDLLLRQGWSVPKVALCSYGITGLLVLAGISLALHR